MAKTQSITNYAPKDISRPGVYAKTKQSKIKTSKLYKKPYKGQGR